MTLDELRSRTLGGRLHENYTFLFKDPKKVAAAIARLEGNRPGDVRLIDFSRVDTGDVEWFYGCDRPPEDAVFTKETDDVLIAYVEAIPYKDRRRAYKVYPFNANRLEAERVAADFESETLEQYLSRRAALGIEQDINHLAWVRENKPEWLSITDHDMDEAKANGIDLFAA